METNVSRLERLPTEILYRICELAAEAQSLRLTSQRLRSVASAILYSNIQIPVSTIDRLHADIDRWTALFRRTASFHYVRSLVLTSVAARPLLAFPLQSAGQYDLDVEWQPLWDKGLVKPGDSSDQAWQPLADLVCLLPRLSEVHYICSPQLAPCLLSAIESRAGCRLFLNTFSLRSLIQPRSKVIDVESYEARIATSPSLYGIVSTRFKKFQNIIENADFNEEGVIAMTSGISPNLKHVSMFHTAGGCSLWQHNQMANMPLATWQGTEFGKVLQASSMGALASLEFAGDALCELETLQNWARATDFSKLTTLKLRSGVKAPVLRWLATNASWASLRTLAIDISDENKGSDTGPLLVAFLNVLPPLRCLQLTGVCNHDTLRQSISFHAETLRKLVLLTSVHAPRYRWSFDSGTTAIGQWKYPRLEELHVPFHRSDGDAKEVQFYESLGRTCPALRKVLLALDCSHDRELTEQETQDPDFDRFEHNGLDYDTPYDLKYTLRNHAIDEALTKAIFRKIDASKPIGAPRLQNLNLRTTTYWQMHRHPRGVYLVCGHILCNQWTCDASIRDDEPDKLLVKELERSPPSWDGEPDEYVMRAFERLWPTKVGQTWRSSWHSFPLAEGETSSRT